MQAYLDTCFEIQNVVIPSVLFDDGDYEDMDYMELFQCRASRPLRLNPVRGRQLCSLELFSGCGIISQEFAERKWKVRSIDNDPRSYATDKVDIMKMTFENIGMVPDFIWASPPCFTYSNMVSVFTCTCGGLLSLCHFTLPELFISHLL